MDNIFYIKDKGCQTLLAWINKGPYPMPQGNEIRYGHRRLVNLHAENLDYLLDNNLVSFPIKCKIQDERNLIVIDERIPPNFLFDQRIIDRDKPDIKWKKIEDYKGFITDGGGFIYCPYMPVLTYTKKENP